MLSHRGAAADGGESVFLVTFGIKMNKLSFNLTLNIYKYSKKYAETAGYPPSHFIGLCRAFH